MDFTDLEESACFPQMVNNGCLQGAAAKKIEKEPRLFLGSCQILNLCILVAHEE
jgi:hypothetical protein